MTGLCHHCEGGAPVTIIDGRGVCVTCLPGVAPFEVAAYRACQRDPMQQRVLVNRYDGEGF